MSVLNPSEHANSAAFPPVPPGCQEWVEERGYHIAQIHYSADPGKNAAWYSREHPKSVNEATWRQEQEIDFHARSGALLYPEFNFALNVCEPFPIPHDWTRRMAIDPHKRRPHAFLWMAVAPDGDHYYFREYWPSRIYGKKGNTPDDDELYHIDQYVKTLNWLEGEDIDFFAPGGFANNSGRREQIPLRIMDTHGKAIFSSTRDGRDDPETFWDRYTRLGIICQEAQKDVDVGRNEVGKRLRPRPCMYADGLREESVIHIFSTCPELIHEFRTARWPVLTPAQAEKQDPSDKPLQKRTHMLDLIRYIEITDPIYVPYQDSSAVSKRPIQRGIAY